MLKTAAKAVRVATRNWITTTSGTVLAACTGAKSLGVTYPIVVRGNPVDAVLAGMAISAAVLGWAAKDGNKHSSLDEVKAATPGVGQ